MRKVSIVAQGEKVMLDVPERLPGQPGHDWIPLAVNEIGAAIGCAVCMQAFIAKDPDDAEKQMGTYDLMFECVPGKTEDITEKTL